LGGGGSRGVTHASEVGEPQTAGENPHHRQRHGDAQTSPWRLRVFFVTWIGDEPCPFLGTDLPEIIRHGHISSTGSTPITARPEAITIATPRTRASRARVSAGSEARINRNVVSSRPLFHNIWNCAATSSK